MTFATGQTRAGKWMSAAVTQQGALAGLLVVETAIFGAIGTNFLTVENGFEVLRLSVEIGLLSLALTPVIMTGGIDLSVGSLMGLSAVLFGKMWRDAGLPIWAAGLGTLVVGAAAGGISAVLVTRFRIPALIVTLGTFSLWRGLAEGMTAAVDNFTGFPASFLFLGQGYLVGGVPAQLPVFVVVAGGFWVMMHRMTVGRALVAIGYSGEGARHAGISVRRTTAMTYVLCGMVASLSAIIYVSHLGQAKADAGTGYELLAITAVVLGGTSIFGGSGSIHGTLLGLFAIAILKRGLMMADYPAELAGILSGVVLIGSICLNQLVGQWQSRRRTAMRTIVLAAVAATMLTGLVGCKEKSAAGGVQVTVAMMPKSKGNAYFIACRKGAEEAARELNVKLIWDGPTDPDPAKQNEVVDTWITRGVDVIAVAVENREGMATVLRKARAKGIKVLTWDADSEADARDFFVNQATPRGIGETLMDHAGRLLGGKGEFAIITASLTAANMIEWQTEIEKRRAEKWPNIKMVALRPCDDKQGKAFDETNAILSAHPGVRLIMAICSPAVPGAAEAVKQSGRNDVKVIGLGLPNDNRRYVKEGITDCIVLWNTMDLGYLTVTAAKQLKEQKLKSGDTTIDAGRLGRIAIEKDHILLGTPFTFTKDNIDGFDF